MKSTSDKELVNQNSSAVFLIIIIKEIIKEQGKKI